MAELQARFNANYLVTVYLSLGMSTRARSSSALHFPTL